MAEKQSTAALANAAIAKTETSLKKKETIFDLVKRQSEGFKMALPNDFDVDRFTRICLTILKNNQKLASCEPTSLLGALMTCAQLGLEPNTPLKEAYLIPYKDQCQFQISYRGLEKLAWNSGLIEFIDYDKICENDEFEFVKGLNPNFYHKPNIQKERGEAFAYYAVAGILGGGRAIIVKSKDEIMKHARRFSKTWNGKNFGGKYNSEGIWDTDTDAMAIKTVLIELIDKKLPKRTTNEALKFARAASLDNKIVQIDKKDFGSSKAISLEEMNITDLQEFEEIDENTGEIKEKVPTNAKTPNDNEADNMPEWMREN